MSWETVMIPDVVFFQEGPGVRNTQFTVEGVKLLNVGNINNGVLNLDATKISISEKEAFGKYNHFLVEEGDLLIASSGIIVDNFHNKIAWARKEHLPLCMNTSTIRFKTLDSDVLDIKYFSYFLKTRIFSNQLRKLITGSAQLNFGSSHLKQISLPLPPLPTQKRIAEILDAADALKRKDQELLKKYDELAQAIFIDMFGDPVRNEKGWEVNTIRNVASKEKNSIKAGPFGSSLKKEFYKNEGYKIYGQEQVIADDLSIGNYYIDEEKFESLKSCSVKAGDVLISLVGTYGKIAIVPDEFEEGIINPRLMKISLDRKKFNPVFFKNLLKTEQMFKAIGKYSRGGTMDIVNVGVISEVDVIIPPIELQNLYVQRISIIEEQIRIISTKNSSSILFNSLIQKAFKGELVA